jgi:hypothetical protein
VQNFNTNSKAVNKRTLRWHKRVLNCNPWCWSDISSEPQQTSPTSTHFECYQRKRLIQYCMIGGPFQTALPFNHTTVQNFDFKANPAILLLKVIGSISQLIFQRWIDYDRMLILIQSRIEVAVSMIPCVPESSGYPRRRLERLHLTTYNTFEAITGLHELILFTVESVKDTSNK